MKKPEFSEIALFKLRPSPTNPRKTFNEAELHELAESIKAEGVLQPITVRTHPEEEECFEIVCGERRFRASALAEMQNVPAIIRELSDEQVLIIQITENLQRVNVPPLEEAEGFKNLMAIKSAEEIANLVGKHITYVYKRMQLNELIDEAKQLMTEEILPVSHALQLCRLPQEAQEKALKFISIKSGKNTTAVEHNSKLRQFIDNSILLNLSNAPFNTASDELCPLAGACTVCPKRTGYNRSLFNDIEEADRCTDEACFNNKKQVNYELTIQNLKKKKKAYVLISDEYWSDNEEVLTLHDWEECPKNEKGARIAVYAEGKNMGKQIWITPEEEPYKPTNKSEELYEEEAQEELEENIRAKVLGQLKEAIEEKISENISVLSNAFFIHAIMNLFDKTDSDDFYDVVEECIGAERMPMAKDDFIDWKEDHRKQMAEAILAHEGNLFHIINKLWISTLDSALLYIHSDQLNINANEIENKVRAELTPTELPAKEKKTKKGKGLKQILADEEAELNNEGKGLAALLDSEEDVPNTSKKSKSKKRK